MSHVCVSNTGHVSIPQRSTHAYASFACTATRRRTGDGHIVAVECAASRTGAPTLSSVPAYTPTCRVTHWPSGDRQVTRPPHNDHPTVT
ncbi:unnamed protein product [Sphagnum balticum]